MENTNLRKAVCVVSAALLYAQTPEFEVASIKPHSDPVTVSGGTTSGTRAVWTAVTLIDLIAEAYGVRYDQVLGGPRWVGLDRFDIAARAGGASALTRSGTAAMLRKLLTERFQLQLRHETRDLPVYWLVVGKGGAKLKAPDASGKGMRTRVDVAGVHIFAWDATMEQLANQLSNTAGRPVLDQTGFAGRYGFQLDFVNVDSSAPDSDMASLPAALRELGLRLEPAKAATEVLVIVSAERPAEN